LVAPDSPGEVRLVADVYSSGRCENGTKAARAMGFGVILLRIVFNRAKKVVFCYKTCNKRSSTGRKTMFEICTLLKQKKTAKKVIRTAKPAKIGAKVVWYFGGAKNAEIIAKHQNKNWWTVKFETGLTASGDRSCFKVVS
jgi:hypothetical protein